MRCISFSSVVLQACLVGGFFLMEGLGLEDNAGEISEILSLKIYKE